MLSFRTTLAAETSWSLCRVSPSGDRVEQSLLVPVEKCSKLCIFLLQKFILVGQEDSWVRVGLWIGNRD